MFKELELSETDSVLAAYNAVCELVEETERLQAACAAKTAELAELREQTAELFAERVAAEGADDDAVHAAMVMWMSDPQSAAQAVLGCDIAEAANPYGCNQYGHEWRGKHGEGWKPSGRGGNKDEKGVSDNHSDSDSPEAFEKASPEKRAEIMQRWKNKIRDAQKALSLYKSRNYKNAGSDEYESEKKRLKNEVDKEIERFKDKVKQVGRLRGWDDNRSESTAKTLLIPVIS